MSEPVPGTAVEALLKTQGVDLAKHRAVVAAGKPDPDFIPMARRRIMLPPWRVVQLEEHGGAYEALGMGLRVIATVSKEEDGRHWLHVSCSTATRIPTWKELRQVKDLFIGKDRVAIQILPDEKNYINQHPYCLHLFTWLQGEPPLPDFTRGTGTL